MLVLLLRIGDRRFGLDARDVVEVVPAVPLLPVAQAPDWIAGLLRHRDGVAPVVDLARLVRGTPATPRLSTRIVLLRRAPSAPPPPSPAPPLEGDAKRLECGGPRRSGSDEPLVALLAEGVTEMLHLDESRLRDAGLRGAPWLGPVALDDGDVIQLVRWLDLVPPEQRAALLAEAEA